MIEINDLQEDYLLTELSSEQTTVISGGSWLGRLLGGIGGAIVGAFVDGISVSQGIEYGSAIGDLII